jgi:predicted HTH domain antitoxin
MTNRITLDLPEEFAKTLGNDVARETLIAAVLRWFEEGKLSQGQAAEMLALNRGEFFDLLQQHRVSPIQMTVEELDADFARG